MNGLRDDVREGVLGVDRRRHGSRENGRLGERELEAPPECRPARSSVRRAEVPARCSAGPDRRTIAPTDAPESSSPPAITTVTPTIIVPVSPTRTSDDVVERPADRSAVRAASVEHQAERDDEEPEPERAQVDERAPAEHQRAEHDEGDGRDVAASPITARRRLADPLPHATAVPAEVEHGREEEPDRGQPEADQLGMVMAARPAVRFLTREGSFGRSLERRFRRAMHDTSAPPR